MTTTLFTQNVFVHGEQGWVSLYRKLKQHPRYKDSEFVHVWIHLLLSATHTPRRAIFAGEEILLQPGQLITGRHAIARDTGIHESKVKRVLLQLKADQQIDQQTSNTCSLISIRNWRIYQNADQRNDQPLTNHRPADGQRVTTHNNDNSGIISIERAADAKRPSWDEVKLEAQRIGLAEWKAQDWFNEMEGCGWLDHMHRPIVAWRAVLVRVKVKWEADGRPTQPPSRNPVAGSGNPIADSNNRPASAWGLSKQIEAIEQQVQELRNTRGHEDAFGWHPKNEEARKAMSDLRKRKRELQSQLASLNQ